MPSIFSKDTAKNTTTTAITNASQPHLNPVDTSNRVKASNLQAWLKEFIDWVFSSNAADLRGCTPIVDSTVNSTNTDYQNIVWQQVVPIGTCLPHFDINLDGVSGDSTPTGAPDGFLFAEGAIVNINDYPVLYTKLGTRFGGDGVNTFGLPNMEGKTMLGFNSNTATTPSIAGFNTINYGQVGNSGGVSSATLSVSQIPKHRHDSGTYYAHQNLNGRDSKHRHKISNLNAIDGRSYSSSVPEDFYRTSSGIKYTDTDGRHEHDVVGSSGYAGSTSTNPSHENRMPYMVTRWIIKY